MWKASQGMRSSNPSTRKADTSRFLEFTGSRSNQICEVKVKWESVSQKIIWRTIAQDIWHQPQTSISKLTYTQAHEYPCTKLTTQVRERDLNLGIWKEFPALQCALYKETLTFVDVWFSSPVLRSPRIPLLWWSNSEKHQAGTVVIYLQLLLTHTLNTCVPLQCKWNDFPLKITTEEYLSTRMAW